MRETFQAIRISEHVYWVGAIDHTIREFHGYSTERGSTYNAFLVLGSKPILIDTVKAPFFTEMMARIRSVIDPQKIAYIISNHAELDHSGSLVQAAEVIHPEKIFASPLGAVALQAHFHKQLEITEINNLEDFTLGDQQFRCLETRMLHWPDSMCTYLFSDQILFSQDGFGMHYATTNLLASQNDATILAYEAKKYFANILLPYANFVTRLLDALPTWQLPIKLLAPDHGPLWDTSDGINTILQHWRTWAQQPASQKVVICYDTMWESTALIARALADSIMQMNLPVRVMSLAENHRSNIVTELIDAGAILLGSPTFNNNILPRMADLCCYLQGLKVKNLLGQAFGSFGWSGESTSILKDHLVRLGVQLIGNPIKIRYVPTQDDLVAAQELGEQLKQQLLQS